MPPQPTRATTSLSLAATFFFSPASANGAARPAAAVAEAPRNCRRLKSLIIYLPGENRGKILLFGQIADPNISEIQVGGRVMSLEAERLLVDLAAGARALRAGPLVGKIGHLVAVDPGGHVLALRHYRHGEPLVVAGNHFASRLAIVNASGAIVHRLGPVLALPLIADLGFVAAPELARQAAEKDAPIEILTLGKYPQLQPEIIPLTFGLAVAVAILDLHFASFFDSA